MKSMCVSFHANKRTTLLITTTCFLSLLFVSLLAMISTNENIAELLALLKSKYNYSAVMNSANENDSYIQVDAGITFTIAPGSSNSLNATVLMQGLDTEYTDLISWNANKLSHYGVAISNGLARKNGLEIGDIIYSKHVVTNETQEYSVEEILPEVITSRVQNKKMFNSGLIIMGYDSQYSENISCSTLLFTDKSINELSNDLSNSLREIIYREDEVILVTRALAPYVLLFFVLAIIAMILFVQFLSKSIKHNYKRLISLGYDSEILNGPYNRFICVTGCTAILCADVIMVVITSIMDSVKNGLIWVLVLSVAELISLFISLCAFRKKCWR